jgi:hypothetical protein
LLIWRLTAAVSVIPREFSKRAPGVIYWQPENRRGLSPLNLVHRAFEAYPESFDQALKRLDRLNRDVLEGIVKRVPAGWMSELARTFAVELMCHNANRLKEISA